MCVRVSVAVIAARGWPQAGGPFGEERRLTTRSRPRFWNGRSRRWQSAVPQRIEGGRARVDVVGEALGLGEGPRHLRRPDRGEILRVEGDDDRRRKADGLLQQMGIVEESDSRDTRSVKTEIGMERAVGNTGPVDRHLDVEPVEEPRVDSSSNERRSHYERRSQRGTAARSR